jgi:hypothetical protein
MSFQAAENYREKSINNRQLHKISKTCNMQAAFGNSFGTALGAINVYICSTNRN